jgi:hypothetical protein
MTRPPAINTIASASGAPPLPSMTTPPTRAVSGPGADERDKAMFAKLRDYMIRVDDSVTCKTCGKKFDIPSQHSMVFLEKGGAAAGPAFTGGDDEDSRFNR